MLVKTVHTTYTIKKDTVKARRSRNNVQNCATNVKYIRTQQDQMSAKMFTVTSNANSKVILVGAEGTVTFIT